AAATDGLEAPFAAIVRREDSILRLAAVRADGVDGVAGGARVAASSAGTLVAAMDAQEPVTLPARALTVLPELVPIVAELAVVSALCAPLRWAGRSRDALLVAGSARARPFDDADRDHLAGIAHLAELAIGNAERYRSLLQLASTDSLTGVATAPAFERALAEPHPDGLSIVVVDVDRLKEVNDVTGYPAGDETLRRIATALTSIAGDAGLIGRIGGDEFAVLVDGADEEAAADLGDRIRSAMHGVPVPHGLARVSIGVAVGSGTIDRRRVYWSALAAAETATAQGGDAVVRASGLIQPTGRRGPWDHALAALFNGTARVVPVYQPVVRLRDGNVVGHEALARLADAPERGVEGLFAAAQRVGRARDLDWLCRRVALEGARGMASGTMLFVNVGVWALLDRLHDVDQMQLLLRWAGLSAGDVVLELSERELVSDLPRLLEVITSYRAEGFRFAVDDLGEGHSTLEVLSRATPEFIKLASSLTLARSTPGVQSAVAAMVTFAERSGASVIAEGIETAESVQFMLDMGVELGQGRFLGPPGQLPAASAEHAETLEPAT
ncbi:MAG TPA: EAL domain-containing protein, partial [Candidatus Dormibacteraeota bacterium]|nr:EAL domain-containing protein [Candidatus Dormibacteraeota bacterium]